MHFLAKFIGILFKLTIVVLVNFLLFVVIPLTHNLFNTTKGEAHVASGPRIIAELIRPPKQEEKKQVQPRLRQVNASAGNRSGTNRMNYKFTPDLAIGSDDGVAVVQDGQMESIIFNEGETDEDAVPIFTPPLQYPDRVRNLEIEGDLEVTLTIGIDGKITAIDVLSSPHPLLTQEAQKVLQKWKFKPAMNKGIPVRQKVKQIIEFRLDS